MKHITSLVTLILCSCAAFAQPPTPTMLDSLRVEQRTLRWQIDSVRQAVQDLQVAAHPRADVDAKAMAAMDRAVQMTGNAIGVAEIASGVFAAILAILIGLGFLEARRWRRLRSEADTAYANSCNVLKETEEQHKQIKESANQAKAHIAAIEGIRSNLEQSLAAYQERIANVDASAKPSPETRAAADEASRLMPVAEAVGARLTAADWYTRAIHYYFSKSYDSSLDAVEKALSLKRNHAGGWYLRGVLLSTLKRPAEALIAYDEALALKPREAATWSGKGVALDLLGRKEEALAACDRALTLDPNSAYAWDTKGHVLFRLGLLDEALTAYEKASTIAPSDSETWADMGLLLHYLGRSDEALAAYDKALALDPTDATTWNNKGYALASLRRPDQALTALEKALTLDPSFGTAWSNKSQLLSYLGRHDEAKVASEKARTLCPSLSQELYDRVTEHARSGRLWMAVWDLERAVMLDDRLRERAKADEAFVHLRDNSEFRRIVGLDLAPPTILV